MWVILWSIEYCDFKKPKVLMLLLALIYYSGGYVMELFNSNLKLMGKKNIDYLIGLEKLTGISEEQIKHRYRKSSPTNEMVKFVEEIWNSKSKQYKYIDCFDFIYGKLINHLEKNIYFELQNYTNILSNKKKVVNECCKYFFSKLKPILNRTLILEVKLFENKSENPINRSQIYEEWEQLLINEITFFDLFLNKYPVLLQAIMNESIEIIATLVNLFQRINSDYYEIRQKFNLVGGVVGLELGLGDPHIVGETVAIVHFSKNKVVYKPESAKLNQCVEEILFLLRKCNHRINLYVPISLDKNEYHWSEYCDSEKIEDDLENKSYHYNMGFLTAILHAFNAHDMHKSNLIIQQNKFYLIDLECFFTNIDYNFSDTKLDYFRRSILGTHLIPSLDGEKHSIYQAGLHKPIQTESIYKLINPYESNVSLKKLTRERDTSSDNHYDIRWEQDVIQGFEDGYDVLSQKKDQLINIIKEYCQYLKVRVLIRSSVDYGKLIYYSFHPRFLINSIDRNAFLTLLYSNKLPIELQKIEYGNIIKRKIPLFKINLNGSTIENIDKNVMGQVSDTPFNQFVNKINNFSTEEKNEQKYLLRKSLKSFINSEVEYDALSNRIDYQKQLFGTILNNIEPLNAGFLYNISYLDRSPLIHKMDCSIYNGTSGMSFIFLCMFIVTGSMDWLLKSESIHDSIKSQNEYDNIGIYTGLGSKAYLSFLLFKHTRKQKYYKSFMNYVLTINQNIEKIDKLDFLSGLSGSLILLINSNKFINSNVVTETIDLIVKKILRNVKILNDNLVTWENELTGLSHGNSGILYALSLYNSTKQSDIVSNLIDSALKFEFKYKYNSGWFDLREKNKNVDMNAWCHGAPGILYSRKSMLNFRFVNKKTKELISDDILLGNKLLNNFFEIQDFSLCHGLAGNFICGGVPDEIESRLIRELLNRVENIKNGENLDYSLMTGVCGVIYSLMYKHFIDIPNLLIIGV